MMKNSALLCVLFGGLVFLTASCGSINKCGQSTRGLPYPLMLGPVQRIGGGKAEHGPKLRNVSGKTCRTETMFMFLGTPIIDVDYNDKLTPNFYGAGSADTIGIVNNIVASSDYHISLFSLENLCVQVSGDIWSKPTTVEEVKQ